MAQNNQPASANTSLIEELLPQTNFDRREFEVLQRRFQSLKPTEQGNGTLKASRQNFRDMLGKSFSITDSLIMDRVFRVFDQDADNLLTLPEFVKGLSTFLKGGQDDLIKYCFKIYDLNGDRNISKEEMFQLLQNCLVRGSDEDDDGVRDIVDIVLKKLDEDRDGRVNEQDWHAAVSKDSLLLEAFGQCLPDQYSIDEFLETPSDVNEMAALQEALGLKKSNNDPISAIKNNAKQVAKPTPKLAKGKQGLAM